MKIKKKTYCVDIDGVICRTTKNFYKQSKPNKKAITKINQLYLNGNRIIIFTARFMGRSNENISLAKKRGYKFYSKRNPNNYVDTEYNIYKKIEPEVAIWNPVVSSDRYSRVGSLFLNNLT